MRKLLLLLIVLLPVISGYAQKPVKANQRPAAFAGSYYAADPEDLRHDLEFLFGRALPSGTAGTVLAVIVPHAGYPFSGETAASGYSQVDAKKSYKNIFIIGNSHNYAYEGAAIYRSGNFMTPFGEVPVNIDLANELYKRNEVFVDHDIAHLAEHSLEVQLPFLQYRLEEDFRIVPVLLGTRSTRICKKLAVALKPYLTPENLFIISSDFSHYPDYENASIVDLNTAHAICTNDPEEFLKTLEKNEENRIPNLLTSACAWPSILTLMYMTSDDAENLEYKLIQYRNSGDAAIGDKSRVVGYCAIAVSRKDISDETGFNLSEKDKTILMEIARSTLDTYIGRGMIPPFDRYDYPPSLQDERGAFVTLNEKGRLRGCIGQFRPGKPLCEVVRDMAIAAATRDPRFEPVKPEELDDIEMEISVLTPLVRIGDTSEIQLGRDGIYIIKGENSGTYLPQVATQTGWNLEEFLGHCAMDKARIGWYGWKNAEIYTYEALEFREKDYLKE